MDSWMNMSGRSVAAMPANTPVADDFVVRPKKRNREKRKGSVLGAASKGQDDAKSSATHLAERASVASATLPRGTLIRAKLVAALDAMRAGAVEAVVAENVMSGGAVVVPAGGTIICSSQISKDGRVPVSCDSIKTADRAWSFSGLAVGEGQHVGLRVLDVCPAWAWIGGVSPWGSRSQRPTRTARRQAGRPVRP